MSPTITISKTKYQKLTEIARKYEKIPHSVREEYIDDDEKPLTPKQKAIIDKGLAEALDDIKKGRTYGPFDTAEEMIASLQRESRKLKARKTR